MKVRLLGRGVRGLGLVCDDVGPFRGEGFASRDGLRRSWAAVDAFGKTRFLQAEGEGVGAGAGEIGEIGEPGVQLQHEKGSGQSAGSDGRIALFHPPKGVPANE